MLSLKVSDPTIELNLDRYKFAVQTMIGEQRGEGVKYVFDLVAALTLGRMASRCLWDSDTDNFAQDTYINVRHIRVCPLARGMQMVLCDYSPFSFEQLLT